MVTFSGQCYELTEADKVLELVWVLALHKIFAKIQAPLSVAPEINTKYLVYTILQGSLAENLPS